MTSPNVPRSELVVCLHLVDASSSLQRARLGLELARRDLAVLDGAELPEVWAELARLREAVDAVQVRVRTLSVQAGIAVTASHTGVGCDLCRIADNHDQPESHGARRGGGAS